MFIICQPPVHVIRTGTGSQGEPSLYFSVTSTYYWIYSDKGSGASMDVTIYRPMPSDPAYKIIGDYAQGNYYAPTGSTLIVRALNDDPNNPLLQPPKDYSLVWNDKGSGGDYDGSIWYPVAPDGYLSIGYVGQTGYDKPYIPNYACVRRDMCVDSIPGPLIWNDRHSGAHMDVSVYQLMGVTGVFLAQGNYNPYVGPCHKFAGITNT